MKTVSVLLSTYNGEKYLREQINSILSQEDVNIKLIVRDDGSTDSTLDILREYKDKSYLQYYNEVNIGYAKSFMNLIMKSRDTADYYAFCDQDDIWDSKKIIKAIEKLEKIKNEEFKLYFSNLTIVDKNLKKIGIKDYKDLKINFKTSMVRFNISGCTMVFNNNLANLAAKEVFFKNDISHDSWIYKVCLAVGGKVIFDENSYIKYRQHNSNVTGVKQGIFKRVKKELTIFNGKKNNRFNQAKIIYNEYYELLSEENRNFIEEIISYKQSLKKTLNLALKKDFKFGLKSVDFLTFLQIITRRY